MYQSMQFSRSVPNVTAGAYHANDVVGGKNPVGIMAEGSSVFSGLLDSLLLVDAANQSAVLDILLFEGEPTAGAYTDNAAPVLSTDTARLIGRIAVAAADYLTINGVGIVHLRNLRIPVRGLLWYVITTTGGPTYASTSDLRLMFGFEGD